ncbi:MAG: DUF6483 family protein [Bacillota bacterium]|nr:DUF6483 family protein [Bacillota bacterium]
MIKNDLLAIKMKQLSEIITKVLSFNEDNNFGESHLVINEAYRQLIGLNSDLVEKLPYEDTVNLISAYESAEVVKLIILAELFKLSSDLNYLEENSEKGLSNAYKSLNVYRKALELDNETTIEICEDNIDKIVERVRDYEIPLEGMLAIFKYEEAVGRFDKAEDMFFEILDSTEEKSELIQEGINFYNRLLGKTEEELEEGNLPKDEVEDGLQRVQNYI